MTHLPNNYNYVPLTLVKQILDAKLEPDIQLLAFQLLTYTAGNSVTLTKEQFTQVAGKRCWNSAKGLLTDLKDARLIHYSTNQHVYITWLQPDGQYYPPFAQSVQSPNIGILGETPIRSQDGVNRENAEQRTDPSPNIGTLGETPISGDGQDEGATIYKTTSSSVSKYLNLLTAFGEVQEGGDPERAYALLTDTTVGLADELALAVSQKIPFEEIVRHTFAWLHDCEMGKVNSVGALANRICQRWVSPPLRHRDHEHPLYQKHVYRPYVQMDWAALREASEKMELDGAASVNAVNDVLPSVETAPALPQPLSTEESQNAPVPQQSSPSLELVTIWTQVLRQLQAQVPASTFTAWLKDTCAIEQQGDDLIVGVPNTYTLEWLQNRLRPMMKRAVTSILGQSVGITFRVQAGGVAMAGACV